MRYTVYLEVQEDGATMAHVPALPGCASTGVTQEVALARVPEAIQAHLAWLRAHNEPVPADAEPIEVEVGGTTEDSDPHLGDEVALLPTDMAPLTSTEIAQLMRLLGHSRQDLLDQVGGVSRELMHWQPPADSEENWCMADILEHVARAERVFTSRLSSNIFDILGDARQAALDRMARLTEQEMSQITEHQGEYWTARKVFRRFLEHELEHTQHIMQILNRFNSAQGMPPRGES